MLRKTAGRVSFVFSRKVVILPLTQTKAAAETRPFVRFLASSLSSSVVDLGAFTVLCALLMFLVSVGLFFVSSPQQILMVEVGQGGGELLGGACVQIAFNGGNAIGAQVGQMVLNTGATYNWIGLAGVPFSIVAVLLLLAFARRYERQYHLKATGRA